MMNIVKAAALVAATTFGFGISAVSAAVIYTDGATDFTGGLYRGAETFSKSFMATAGSSAISFDLFGAKSVDGNNSFQDVFTVAVNGTVVFAGSFDMSGGGGNLVLINDVGWVPTTITNLGGAFSGGVTSISGFINLLAGSNLFSVTFTQPGPDNFGGQGADDESWALNNLDVAAAVPLPAGLPLLLAALGGLGALRLRKRKSTSI